MFALKLINITKRFPGVIANDHISLEIYPGEIFTILGENGAGKTTLMNIIFGIYTPDEGEIYVYGKKVFFKSPKDAYKYGIAMVSQTPKLIKSMSVLENIILGLKEAGIILPIKKIRKKVEEIIERYGLHINLDAKVWQLSASEQKRVEILKALIRGARILILDEPTTSLSPIEKRRLFEFMRRMKEEGNTILFITHKLSEALEVSDRIAVLRKGKLVGVVNKDEATPDMLTMMMFGKRIAGFNGKEETERKETVLIIKDLFVKNDMGEIALKGISLEVKAGEILGIAGVAGNGQKELIEVLMGIRRAEKGEILFRINGKVEEITNLKPKKRLSLGFGIIPEDRIKHGIAPDLSVAENLIIRYYDRRPFSNWILLNRDYIMEWAKRMIEKYKIATPSPEKPAKFLSGGNIQRIIIARELDSFRRFIIAAYPTFGLDVESTRFVRNKLLEQRNKGAAIILISEDLDEILELSDRIAVIYEGEIKGIFDAKEVDVEEIAKLMIGGAN